MWQKQLHKPWVLAVLAGCAVFLAFPCFEIVPTIFLFPFLMNECLSRSKSTREAFWCGYLTSFIVLLGGFYWVTYVIKVFGYLPWAVAVVLFLGFCTFGALCFPAFTTLAFWVNQRALVTKRPLLFRAAYYSLFLPVIFTLVEYLVPKLFPWYIGHCLYRAYWAVQIVEITGSLYLSVAVYSLGSTSWWIYREYQESKKDLKKILPALAVPASLWAFTLIFSAYRLRHPVEGTSLQVALIQPNIGSLDKAAARKGVPRTVRYVVDTYKKLTEKALEHRPKPQLVLWPETAMPVQLDNKIGSYAREIRQAVLNWDVTLITGAYATSPFDFNRDYNAAFLLEPIGAGQLHEDQYFKNILLAFGEYLPLGETFPRLYSLFPQVSNFKRGRAQNAFTLNRGPRLGITICYEAIVPSFYRRVVQNGVQGVVNLTNDSWFGPTSEPFLHGSLTIFRAIESKVPLMRVTNTGTSFIVDAQGRLSEQTPVYDEAVLHQTVTLPNQTYETVYVRFGDWIVILFVATLAIPGVILFRKDAPLPH